MPDLPTMNPAPGDQVVSPLRLPSRATTQRLLSPQFTPAELRLVLDALDVSIASARSARDEVMLLRPDSIALDICQVYLSSTVALRKRLNYFAR